MSFLQPLHSRCTAGGVVLPPGEQTREKLWGWLRFLKIPNDGRKDMWDAWNGGWRN